jgi:hypothetical protein
VGFGPIEIVLFSLITLAVLLFAFGVIGSVIELRSGEKPESHKQTNPLANSTEAPNPTPTDS